MKNRTTPDNIASLKDNEIFIFGANKRGHHGKGAAKTALKWGVKYGQASGLQGKTYAIPTKNASITKTLSIEEIKPYVDEFIEFAKEHQEMTFLVTPIGCGLAGLTPQEVAPLFKEAVNLVNVCLPETFWSELKKS